MRMFKLLLCLFLLTSGFTNLFAQIVDIPLDEYGESYALKATIDADSLNPPDAYRLARGGWYWVTGKIEHKVPLTIIGADEPVDQPPPIILLATDEYGQVPQGMLRSWNDLTLRNVWVAAIDDLENGNSFCDIVGGEKVRVDVEGCYFEYCGYNHGYFDFNPGVHEYDFFFRNNFVFNLQTKEGYNWSRIMYIKDGVAYGDSMIIEQNTFWGISGGLYEVRSEPNYFKVDHNTFVTEGQITTLGKTWRNAQFTNNIYHNIMAHGDAIHPATGYSRANNRGQLDEPLSVFMLDTLSTEYSQSALDSILALAGVPYQTCIITNNNFYLDPRIVTYLESCPDTVVLVPQMINPGSLAMCEADEDFPGLEYDKATNTQVDPGFTADPTDMDAFLGWLDFQLMGGPVTHFMWIYNPETLLDFPWPIPRDVFDFTYSNEALVASDGYHMGDLYHWYPDEYNELITNVEKDNSKIVKSFSLEQNYPNPFNPSTVINYSLSKTQHITLSVYNVLGQKVRTLIDGTKAAGKYSVKWNGLDDLGDTVSAGVYIYRLSAGNETITHRMLFMK